MTSARIGLLPKKLYDTSLREDHTACQEVLILRFLYLLTSQILSWIAHLAGSIRNASLRTQIHRFLRGVHLPPSGYSSTMDEPLMSFKSHIEGKNTDVAIYDDRIEWAQEGRLTLTRMTGAAMSKGKVSSRKSGSSEMIPVKAMNSVTVTKDGFRQAVRVIASGNTIDFRVGRGEAEAIKQLLTDLMLDKHPSQSRAVSSVQASPPAPAPSQPSSSLAEELGKLASLRDSGVLTEEEFSAQKSRLLGG